MSETGTAAVEIIADHGQLEAIERAQIDMQIATAKRYPRDLHKVKQDMIGLATLDEETAQSCFYSLPRGGKTIQGPSVRLAEIALTCWGNMRLQTRMLHEEIGGPAPHVVVQSVCADLEKNVAVSIEKRRRIVGKKLYEGGKSVGNKPPDEDDINLATNACAAIAFRDACFKVVPGALVKAACDAARRVAIGDAKTLATRRIEAIDRFAKMGVDKTRILSMLGKAGVDAIDLNDLERMFGAYTAIKDGQTTIDETFPEKPTTREGTERKLTLPPADPATSAAPESSAAETRTRNTTRARLAAEAEALGLPVKPTTTAVDLDRMIRVEKVKLANMGVATETASIAPAEAQEEAGGTEAGADADKPATGEENGFLSGM